MYLQGPLQLYCSFFLCSPLKMLTFTSSTSTSNMNNSIHSRPSVNETGPFKRQVDISADHWIVVVKIHSKASGFPSDFSTDFQYYLNLRDLNVGGVCDRICEHYQTHNLCEKKLKCCYLITIIPYQTSMTITKEDAECSHRSFFFLSFLHIIKVDGD